MKKLLLIVLFASGTGVLSSTVLRSEKKVEQPMATGFLKTESGFRRDLGMAD